MSKVSLINRDLKRRKIVKKFAAQRAEIFAVINDKNISEEEQQAARVKLQMLPRNASPVRLRSRCTLTGRPRGVYSKFGLGRSKLREIAMSGQIPGIMKASW